MPASSALSSRLARSRDPERDLVAAHQAGEYEEYTDKPEYQPRRGYDRPVRRLRGLSTAQRLASYRRNGSGVQTSRLEPAPDQFKDQRLPDGSLKPDVDMVETASGGQITRVQAEDNARTKRRTSRRLARRDIGSPAMAAKPAQQSIGSSMDGSALDDLPKKTAKPRLARPEGLIMGKPSSQYFKDETVKRERKTRLLAKGQNFAAYVKKA